MRTDSSFRTGAVTKNGSVLKSVKALSGNTENIMKKKKLQTRESYTHFVCSLIPLPLLWQRFYMYELSLIYLSR